MNTLAIAFHGEGPTDWRFFKPLIERLTARLLRELADEEWEVLVLDEFQTEGDNYLQKVTALSNELDGFHLLILHRDGTPSLQKALENHFHDILQDDHLKNKPFRLVPLIPVRETEAWMLADKQWLEEELKALGAKPASLPLPGLQEIEAIADPKSKLEEVIRAALEHKTRRQRKRSRGIEFLYESAGTEVRIEVLERLPAFKEFETSLKNALAQLIRG